MEKIVIYKAVDGRTFSDEDECLLYEFRIEVSSVNFSLFDQDLHILPNEALSSYEDCYYILIKDINAIKVIKKGFEMVGMASPKKMNIGLYYYEDFTGWVSVTEEYKKWKDILERVEQYMGA